MENIVLSIDGKTVSCPAGTSILAAAERIGVNIPTLCHHPDLKPYGACRLCLVEDEKTGRLMASCVTPVGQDMAIQTTSERILQHRRNIIRLMISEHPESCVVCSKGNRCRLRLAAAQLGIGETDLYHLPNFRPLEQANPFIVRDLSKCILCGKCIRADHELVVVGAIDYSLRGFDSRPATTHNVGLEKSECTFCGTCVSMCPTGALSPNEAGYVGTPESEGISICGFCGLGCSLMMGTLGNRIIDVNPSQEPNAVNGATVCVKGHFAHDYLNSRKRLTGPLARKDGNRKESLVPVSWQEAMALVADRLTAIKKEYGPQSIGLMGSSKCTNEENYLFQKIARTVLGTNNIDNGGFLNGQPGFMSLDTMTGGRCRANPLKGLESAEVIIVIGTDPGHSLPVVSYYLKRAARKGIPLIVVDPRPTSLAPFSSIWLPILPKSDLDLIHGLGAFLFLKNGYDAAYIDKYTEGFSLYRYGLSSVDQDRISRQTGLGKNEMEAVAELIKGKKTAFVVGKGILQQRHVERKLGAILNLSLMTGSYGSKGGGIYLLPCENNQVGALDMGAVPNQLPGRQSLADNLVRKQWEEAWKVKLSPDSGLNMVRMIEKAEKGHLKALYIMGENPLRALPQRQRVQNALEKLEFIVVQDILKGETAQEADVVLSGAAFCEKGGSFTNLEGRIQTFTAVVPPPGNAKPDWEILDLLSVRLGMAKTYGSIEKIRSEISKLVPMYRDLSGQADGWIRDLTADQDQAPAVGNGLISFTPYASSGESVVDRDYPVTAILGSVRYHLGAGTRTHLSSRIKALDFEGEVSLSAKDGSALGVKDGDRIRILSREGSIIRPVRLYEGIRPGQIFVPTVADTNSAIDLMNLNGLNGPGSPGWKTCPVKLEKWRSDE